MPLVLLIAWMRFRMLRADTRAALVGAAGADAAPPTRTAPAALPSAPAPR